MKRLAALIGAIGALTGCAGYQSGARPVLHAAHPAAFAARRLWVRTVSPNADSSPAYLAHPRGRRGAIVYVLAANNGSNCNPGDPVRRATLYALNANRGTVVWTRSTTGASRCTTAGPVVDPSGQWVYAPGLDGRVHRYNAASGQEYRSHGWPKRVTLMPDVEKVAATPTIKNGYLYVATSGFIGDQGHYQGHLVTVRLSSGQTHVFNTLCSNVRTLLGPTSGRANYCGFVTSGLFGRGQGVTDPVSHDVYIVSGNGPWNGHTNWGDSILKLDRSGARLVDAFTPTDQSYLQQNDLDLGSSGPAMLPTVKQHGRAYHLLVQAGKGPACANCGPAVLRLLNRDNLSGRNGPGHLGGDLQDIATPGGSEVLTAPAVWRSHGRDWVFYANDSGTAGYRLSGPAAGHFRLSKVWQRGGGTTPVLSGGVLYVAHSGAVVAYRPSSGAVLGSLSIGNVHWEYPLVVGNRLYVTDQSGHVYAYHVG